MAGVSSEPGFLVTTLEKGVNWARTNSMWPASFGLACCAIEMMGTGAAHNDLARFGMLEHFTVLVSGSEVARSKPFPDPYLAALEALGMSPLQAIALEDSQTGYRATVAADIACVVCPDYFIPKPADAFDGAALVTESLEKLTVDALHSLHSSFHAAAK